MGHGEHGFETGQKSTVRDSFAKTNMTYGGEELDDKKRTLIEKFRTTYSGKFIEAFTLRRRQQEKNARENEQGESRT